MPKSDTPKLLATGSFLRELRRRLFLIILLAVIPILGVILYQAKLARDIELGEALDDAWALVESVALREARFIDSAKQLLTLMAGVADLTAGDTATCERFLKPLVEHNRGYAELGVADADGTVRCRIGNGESAHASLANSSHFRGALKAKSFAIGDFQRYAGGRRGSLNFAYPITDRAGAVTSVIG